LAAAGRAGRRSRVASASPRRTDGIAARCGGRCGWAAPFAWRMPLPGWVGAECRASCARSPAIRARDLDQCLPCMWRRDGCLRWHRIRGSHGRAALRLEGGLSMRCPGSALPCLDTARRSGIKKKTADGDVDGLCKMARPERFELPTAWFVARYSIQLSYGRAAEERNYADAGRGRQHLLYDSSKNFSASLEATASGARIQLKWSARTCTADWSSTVTWARARGMCASSACRDEVGPSQSSAIATACTGTSSAAMPASRSSEVPGTA